MLAAGFAKERPRPKPLPTRGRGLTSLAAHTSITASICANADIWMTRVPPVGPSPLWGGVSGRGLFLAAGYPSPTSAKGSLRSPGLRILSHKGRGRLAAALPLSTEAEGERGTLPLPLWERIRRPREAKPIAWPKLVRGFGAVAEGQKSMKSISANGSLSAALLEGKATAGAAPCP
jgi:hypothetical protein